MIPENDKLVVEMPGGGGYGSPLDREPETVRKDFEWGYVTRDHARSVYGVVLDGNGKVDEAATGEARRSMASL